MSCAAPAYSAAVVPAGGLPPALPVRRVLATPGGGLPSLSPPCPAFSFDSAPYPPDPRSQSALPTPGKGETLSLFCRGLSPPAPPALRRERHGVPGGFSHPEGGLRQRFRLTLWFAVSGGARALLPAPQAAGGRRKRRGQALPAPQAARQPANLPARTRGCKGRSPLQKKTNNLPLPHRGRGSGGWGQESFRTFVPAVSAMTPPRGRVKQTTLGAKQTTPGAKLPQIPQNPQKQTAKCTKAAYIQPHPDAKRRFCGKWRKSLV